MSGAPLLRVTCPNHPGRTVAKVEASDVGPVFAGKSPVRTEFRPADPRDAERLRSALGLGDQEFFRLVPSAR